MSKPFQIFCYMAPQTEPINVYAKAYVDHLKYYSGLSLAILHPDNRLCMQSCPFYNFYTKRLVSGFRYPKSICLLQVTTAPAFVQMKQSLSKMIFPKISNYSREISIYCLQNFPTINYFATSYLINHTTNFLVSCIPM